MEYGRTSQEVRELKSKKAIAILNVIELLFPVTKTRLYLQSQPCFSIEENLVDFLDKLSPVCYNFYAVHLYFVQFGGIYEQVES